ncbi:MAG: thioredoxin family protein [Microcoleaceae cyanobacterium]
MGVKVITDQEFINEVQQTEQPVLVYFWAAWCGPCRLMSPAVEQVANIYSDRLKIVKLEVDANPEAVKECQVEGVPALRLFQNNQLVMSHEGAITKAKLTELLDSSLAVAK